LSAGGEVVYRDRMPAVSVIIPVYNGARFLRQAVASVLAEPVDDLEILVVDDGSTDGSAESVRDLPVTVLTQPRNMGATRALNRGLAAARGRLVTFLDADDLLSPGGLTWRVRWLEAHPEARAVGGRPTAIIDEQGQVLERYRHVLTPGYVPPAEITLDSYRRGQIYPVCLCLYLFRRELLDAVGAVDVTLQSAYDCDYVFRAARLTPIPIVFEPTFLRRFHDANLSVAGAEQGYSLNARTVSEVKAICARNEVATGDTFYLWECGYQPG
jgi:glycosyltransferase involved in cell wall biosynthesis